MSGDTHIPVLLQETMDLLQVQEGKWYIDLTFGRGGHTSEIMKRGGNVLATDCDEEALMHGHRMFTHQLEKKQLILVRENFEHIDMVLSHQDQRVTQNIDGVMADFGVSSPQLDKGGRGFSFASEAPLDMRMDQRLAVTAKDLVNALGRQELMDILQRYGGEHHARRIVEAILSARKTQPIETTVQLASVIEAVVPRTGMLHPATKTFMALRMVVNDELGAIERMLPKAFTALSTQGKMVTISFHDGEDRLCKYWMKELVEKGKAELLTKKPIEPQETEVAENIRSRSAKLRGVRKIV